MLVMAITHPDSAARSPRALSEGGRHQALEAARRLRELAGKKVVLGTVLTSPKARCLETAIILARELGETTKDDGHYDSIVVLDKLKEQSEPIKPDTFLEVVKRNALAETAVLVAMHGDLASALEPHVQFREDLVSGGWFTIRPVIACFELELDAIRVVACETYSAGNWVSCVK